MSPDDILLLDMLLAAREARSFASDLTRERFRESRLHQLAIVRCLEIVGEAATRLSGPARERLQDVPWEKIIGMRHRLVHDYSRVNIDKVWATVQQDLPSLINQLEQVVPPEEG